MLIIGIAGGTGSGKTTVVHQIMNELPETEVGIISQDSYYKETNNLSYYAGLRLDLTPSDKFTFYGNANLGITNTKYSINTAQNQTIYNHRFGAEMNVKFPKDFYFNTRFNYNIFLNERFGFNQKQPIWNASVYKQLGK